MVLASGTAVRVFRSCCAGTWDCCCCSCGDLDCVTWCLLFW
jgi:hypothetical protein